MKQRRRPQVTKLLAIHRSLIAGRGVFTHEDIRKGEYILTTRRPYGYYCLIYLNHSCRPNALLKKMRDRYSDELIAVRDVRVGRDGRKELTIDYRHTRWAKEHFFGKELGIINQPGGCHCPYHKRRWNRRR